MIACLDVYYPDQGANAACVLFRRWPDRDSALEKSIYLDRVEPYVPGQFYLRELPCLLAVMKEVQLPIDTVLIDGHVWLRHDADPGLGARLHEALGGKIPVIGVAKSRFRASSPAIEVYRGKSSHPLYVTAAGIPATTAARYIKQMHGGFRIPTLIKRADHLSRRLPNL